jgi:hypothetical protein
VAGSTISQSRRKASSCFRRRRRLSALFFDSSSNFACPLISHAVHRIKTYVVFVHRIALNRIVHRVVLSQSIRSGISIIVPRHTEGKARLPSDRHLRTDPPLPNRIVFVGYEQGVIRREPRCDSDLI